MRPRKLGLPAAPVYCTVATQFEIQRFFEKPVHFRLVVIFSPFLFDCFASFFLFFLFFFLFFLLPAEISQGKRKRGKVKIRQFDATFL